MHNPDVAHYYARMQISTSAAPRIIFKLHQRCVSLLQQAQVQKDRSRRLLDKTQNILVQLERSLIVNDSVSKGMFYLYDYCYCQLETNDDTSITNASSILKKLRDTFEILMRDDAFCHVLKKPVK